jgi:hypothetical protein
MVVAVRWNVVPVPGVYRGLGLRGGALEFLTAVTISATLVSRLPMRCDCSTTQLLTATSSTYALWGWRCGAGGHPIPEDSCGALGEYVGPAGNLGSGEDGERERLDAGTKAQLPVLAVRFGGHPVVDAKRVEQVGAVGGQHLGELGDEQ